MAVHYSFDTESGATHIGFYHTKSGLQYECGDDLRNRVITFARIGVRRLEDVRCLVAKPNEDVYQMFYDHMTKCEPENEIVCHVWNLAWEWKPIMHWYARTYEANDEKWSYDSVVTSNNIYSLIIKTPLLTMQFIDDNNHYHTSVKKGTEELKKIPKYVQIMKDAGIEGKESAFVESLHEIWYSFGEGSKEWNTYIHYAKVDAFCQALLTEHLFDEGRFCGAGCFDGEEMRCLFSSRPSLSASGFGFKDAKSVLIYGCDYKDIPVVMHDRIQEYADKKCKGKFDQACKLFMGIFLDKKWSEKFGILTEEEQLIVERNLRGGLVFGEPGVHRGEFYHYDYKSSYPFEYAYRKLPVASGYRVVEEDGKKSKIPNCIIKTSDVEKMEQWIRKGDDRNVQIYIFGRLKNFKLKEGAVPFITVKECVDNDGMPIKGYGLENSKKVKKGNTDWKLWTYEEWKLIDRCYDVDKYEIKEVWKARAETGFFTKAIEKYFTRKENSTGATKALAKLDLNGATHGKPMMKMLTMAIIDMSVDAKLKIRCRAYEEEGAMDHVKTNPIVGMTAMSHARCRLIEHCMILIENGYRIYMNDTDSMVTDCPPGELERLLGMNGWNDWVIHGDSKKMSDILGRFETEKDGLTGTEMFEEFRCWGLKRYAEIKYTDELTEKGWVENGVNCHLRKSAFAGMHSEDQERILGNVYKERFQWQSSSKKWTGECYALRMHDVDAGKESIWYER